VEGVHEHAAADELDGEAREMKKDIAALTAALVFGMGGIVALGPAPLAAQDASALLGAWEATRETPRGEVTIHFEFRQDGDSVVVFVGEGEDALPMGAAQVEGDEVTFAMDMRAMMGAMMGRRGGSTGEGRQRGGAGAPERRMRNAPQAVPFLGTLAGDVLEGSWETPRGNQTLTLRRVEGG
jgi:uncharacterized protein (TIGR03066 family)